MPTQKKIDLVKEVEVRLARCTIAVTTEYRSMTVAEMTELRRKLREGAIEYVVVKNNLAGIAADNIGKPGLREILKGPTGIAFGYGEVIDAPKLVHEHIRATRGPLSIIGGLMGDQLLTSAEVVSLATLPAMPVLMGQLMGGLLGPLNGVVHALNFHLGGLARALEGRRAQLEASGG
jgi:large subunit ribosomal protein L10